MPDRSIRISRRSLFAVAAVIVAITAPRLIGTSAQEDPAATVATPSAGGNAIRSTGTGAVPSTGASRPGPVNAVQDTIVAGAVAPVGLTIENAGIDAGIEPLRVANGAMQDPSGPWVVAWYENLGALGRRGNLVMAGHIDYWNVGPSVFYNLSTLQPGDEIIVTGEDAKAYPYTVEWVRQFDSTSMPLDEVTGPTDGESLTLITCGGAFDYANGQYLQRTVVRANRSGPEVAIQT